jgi:ABC-2 type transport system permease protein
MDTPPLTAKVKINRFLPYWAVFQADLKQTLHSWIYRAWVVLSFGATLGYLLYRFGAKQVGGFVQPAPEMVGDILHWVVFGSITLIIVLTAGAICAERGTMADAVLSRGISRYQYFLGKLHARLLLVLGTYLAMCVVALAGGFLLLHSDALTLHGSLVAILTVAAVLVIVVTGGVSVSAVSNNTVVSIAIVWLTLYGVAFALSLLPAHYPSPDRALERLPDILRGYYDLRRVNEFMLACLGVSFTISVVGMVLFSRRDV